MTLSRTLMSGVRHHGAPVMPLGPSMFAPDFRHFVGDLDLCLHSDLVPTAITRPCTGHLQPLHWNNLYVYIIYINKRLESLEASFFSLWKEKKIFSFLKENKVTQTIKLYNYKAYFHLIINHLISHFQITRPKQPFTIGRLKKIHMIH